MILIILRSNFIDVARMVTWLVIVALMLGLNGGSSSRVDFQCPEENARISTGNEILLETLLDIPDWRACGKRCTRNSECTFWVYYEKEIKICTLKTGEFYEYVPNQPNWVSGERGCQ